MKKIFLLILIILSLVYSRSIYMQIGVYEVGTPFRVYQHFGISVTL